MLFPFFTGSCGRPGVEEVHFEVLIVLNFALYYVRS
jgi:hypothetical protein